MQFTWILTTASKHHTQRYTEKPGIYHSVPLNFQAVKAHEKKIPGRGCSPEWVLAVGGCWAPAGLAYPLLGSIWTRPTGRGKTTLCANDSSEVMLLPLIWEQRWWWSCGAATRQRCCPSVRGTPREQGSAFVSLLSFTLTTHCLYTFHLLSWEAVGLRLAQEQYAQLPKQFIPTETSLVTRPLWKGTWPPGVPVGPSLFSIMAMLPRAFLRFCLNCLQGTHFIMRQFVSKMSFSLQIILVQ